MLVVDKQVSYLKKYSTLSFLGLTFFNFLQHSIFRFRFVMFFNFLQLSVFRFDD